MQQTLTTCQVCLSQPFKLTGHFVRSPTVLSDNIIQNTQTKGCFCAIGNGSLRPLRTIGDGLSRQSMKALISRQSYRL